MTGCNSKGHLATAETTRVLKVAPVTRAIRQALAVSTAALALAGSGSAFAAITCSPDTGACTDVVAPGDVTIVNSDVLQGGPVGLHGQSTGSGTSVTITNQAPGEVHALLLVNGTSYGIRAEATDGTVLVNNAGLVDAENEDSNAIGIDTLGVVATVANTGEIRATGKLFAAGIEVEGDVATASNSGDIAASVGNGWARGIHLFGEDASVTNSGNVAATSASGHAWGITADADQGVSIDNSGSVSAMGTELALGVTARVEDGEAFIGNSGTITASAAYAGGAVAVGSSVRAINSGDILVAGAQPDSVNTVFGVEAAGQTFVEGSSTDVLVENSGTIDVHTDKGFAEGILANGDAIGVVNSGDIFAHGSYWAAGVDVDAADSATIATSGAITATAHGGDAVGVLVGSFNGNVSVDNSGSITANGVYDTLGIVVESNGIISIVNSGDILAEQDEGSEFGDVIGIVASGSRAAERLLGSDALTAEPGDITIDTSGNITARGAQRVTGIEASSAQGSIIITQGDAGEIVAQSAQDYAFGIRAETYEGVVTIDNAGTLAVSGLNAEAITAFNGSGSTSVTNSGDIGVEAEEFGFGIAARSYTGDVSVSNLGAVDVLSQQGRAVGLVAFTESETSSVTNSGDINVDVVEGGSAVGIGAIGGHVAVAHSGDITVKAGGAESYATGLVVNGVDSAELTIASTGSIDTWAASEAVGALLTNYTEAAVVVNNAGDIHAATDAGWAMGLFLPNHAGFTLTNSGSIAAEALAGGDAFGVFGPVDGDARIDNSGDIVARATNEAIAIALNTDGAVSVEVNNTGTIRAESENYAAVAISNFQGDSTVQIANQGDIFGAIVTGYADDTLANGNGGLWQVVGAGTDFGAGNDSITNAAGGTIHLVNGSISLGSSSAAGNAFTNQGTLRVTGESLIDMGTGVEAAPTFGAATPAQVVPAAVPSLNPLALVNNGTIDMMDGVAGDVLTITGDLSGTGNINMDVSLLNGSNDLLIVDGSVAAGSVQTVNVQVDKTPDPEMTPVGLIRVTGDSTAGSFVAGEVTGFSTSNFLDVDVAISSTIDASNETDDVFYFGVTVSVSGLNDGGLLAASIASGAHSLFNSQIGTWQQRMGVYPDKVEGDVGISPWVRVFSDGGEYEAAHTNQSFGNGVLGYDQSNRGSELGLNVNIRDGLNVGLLLADSDAKQRLTGEHAGYNRINARTVGLYGTWVSATGFYVDLSHRWMGFDADVYSPAGEQSTSGDAAAWNVEAGYTAWTLPGGVDVTPQLQYTRSEVTNVDALYGDSAAFVGKGGVSKRGRAGVAFSREFESAGLRWTPYGSVNAVREFDGKTAYAVNDAYFGAVESEGTSTLVELGLGLQKDSLSVTGGAHWNDGGSLQNFVGGQLVLRYTW